MAKPQYRWPMHSSGLRLNKWIIKRDPHCRVMLRRCKHTDNCQGCSEVPDHIIPAESGGAYFDENNLRGACSFCNQDRRNQTSGKTTPTHPEYW